MKKILVIDDETSVCATIKHILTVKGFQTFAAEDGRTGLRLAQMHQPDLILCDVAMPDFDGYEVLSALRSDLATATIPFIFATAFSDKQNMRQGMELGADDYLAKPFTVDELVNAVNSRLKKHDALLRHSEEKMAVLRETIGITMPHELRTPLNGILGFSALMAEENPVVSDAEIRDLARHVHKSALRLHVLIERFLSLVQLDHSTGDSLMALTREGAQPFSARTIVEEVATQAARDAERVEDLSLVLADYILAIPSDHMVLLVRELAENALKFSKRGTAVRIATELKESSFALSVRNNGRGMTSDQISRIGAYVQFDRRTFEQQGCGLGLMLVKRIVELHKGELSVVSIPGNETTVTVSLPIHPGPTSE
jgi:two-component system, sensor histidine kinase and response regulator